MARLNGSPFTSMEGDRKTSRKSPERPVNVLLKEVIRNVPVTMVVRHVKTNNTTFSQGNFCCGASSSSISAEGLNVLSMKEVFLFSAGSSADRPPFIEAARYRACASRIEAARYRACASRGQPGSVGGFFLRLHALLEVSRYRAHASRALGAAACLKRQRSNPQRLERLQILAGLEPYGFSRRYIHFRTCAGVSANARLPRLDGKYTKSAQLDPVVCLQGILHAIKDRIHSLFSFCFADSCPLDDLIHKIEFDHWNLRF